MIYLYRYLSNFISTIFSAFWPLFDFIIELPLRIFYFIIYFSDKPFRDEKVKIGNNDMLARAAYFLFTIGMLSIIFLPLFLKK